MLRSALAVILLLACGPQYMVDEGSAPRPSMAPVPSPFPSLAELEQIVASAPPPALGEVEAEPSEAAWTPTEPAVPGDPPYEPSTPVELLVVQVAAGQGAQVRWSASLRCAAREWARFLIAHGAAPRSQQRDRIGRSCGSSVLRTASYHIGGRGPFTEATLAREHAEPIRQWLTSALANRAWIGVAFERRGDEGRLVVVAAAPRADLSWSAPDANGVARVQGRSLAAEPQPIIGLITQGEIGYSFCRQDSSLAWPEIAFDCPYAAGDPAAIVQLAIREPSSLRMHLMAELEIRRAPDPTPVTSVPANDRAAVTPEALVEIINARRTGGGLAPVTLAAEESQHHARLAPALFGLSQAPGLGSTADRLLLGLMAGWHVRGGRVRDATSVWAYEERRSSPAELIAELTAAPIGRVALYSPHVRQLAIAVVGADDPHDFGLVATGYLLHDDDAVRRQVATAFFDRIVRERVARGLRPPIRIQAMDGFERAVAPVRLGQLPPDVALQQGLDTESERQRIPLAGTVVLGLLPELLPIPDGALSAGAVGIVVADAPFAQGSWSHYVVYVVTSG